MTNKLQFLIIALLLIVAGYSAGSYKMPAVNAQQTAIVIPKDWGTVKASVDAYLVFEAADGTIHICTMNGRLMAQINRQ